MFNLIDIYVKVHDKWKYLEGTRMHKTLVAAEKHAAQFHGGQCKAKFAAHPT